MTAPTTQPAALPDSRSAAVPHVEQPPVDFLVPGLPFSGPELRGMELSGLLVHVVGDLYLPANHGLEDTRVRAASVLRLTAPVITGSWASTGLTAAWIHAGGGSPGVLEASVEHFQRIPSQPLSVRLHWEQSDVARDSADVVNVFGLRCTTVDRTIEDVLRRAGPRSGPPAMAAAARLLTRTDSARLRRRFEDHRRKPGMVQARRRLETLLA
ncbi:hypothetical protein [Citricoccus sp. GCM10030269]|uniref:hypothetical protein n=1 Tax=Citricoccus sp. GCM10030269 TaxID=3273388 RepID=UPI00361CCAC8